MKNYEIFEHTADIGLRVKGKDLKELFKSAGLAIFEISSRKQFTKNKNHINLIVRQNADNLDELFINWLNELLSLSSAKGVIFHGIKINKFENNSLEAQVVGSDMNNYKVNMEIKAATYHGLKIIQDENGYIAEVVLDV
ncbi:MAG: archease [Candidatus Omnitrophica bacterium]|nr:archease [Candidatus Omnitrophota bacterium]